MKVGFTSALGALVGGTVAWYWHHAWWAVLLGLVLGGLAGYLSYEWKIVQQTAVRVFKTEIRIPHPNKNAVLYGLGSGIYLGGTMGWIGSLLFFLLTSMKQGFPVSARGLPAYFLISFPVFFSLAFAVSCNSPQANNPKLVRELWKDMPLFNPIMLPFTLTFLGTQKLWRVKRMIALGCWKVVKRIFIAIHCEERVQSAFYGVIGVLVGHFASHSFAGVLIGTVAGFVFGWGSHKLISIRFLKPTTS